MTLLDRDEWQLTPSEVYPRQATYGFQLAQDDQHLTFILQRDKRAEEVVEEDRKSIRETVLADLCIIPVRGGYPRPITSSGDMSNPATWSPDGQHLAFERGGSLQVIPAAGGKARTIFTGEFYHPPLELGDAWLGYPRWSPNSKHLLFATRRAYRTALRLASIDGGLQRELLTVEGYLIGWDWSPDGRQVLIVTRSEDGSVGDVRLLDVDTGGARVLWEERDYEYQKPVAAWTPNGERIVFRSNRSGWAKLWTGVPDGSEVRSLTGGAWDDYAFRMSPHGRRVVFASRAEQVGTADDLWVIDLAGGEPQRLTQHPGINVPLAWSRMDRILYWHSSPTEPGDLWTIPASGGEPDRLTWRAPIELERKLRAPEEHVITSDDGTRIPSLVYLPAYHQDGERYPGIVWIHGGPTSICRYEYRPFCNWLANQGYVVILPNYRGSIGLGLGHMTAVAGEGLGKNDLNDILAAGKYLKALPYVNYSRGIGVGGHSWGGYLTLMAVTQAPDMFSCAVAGAAITDWRIQQAQTAVRYYDRWLVGGWVYEQTQRARERSPITFADRITVPLFVFHGEEDHDVPFAQIGEFVAKAQAAGVMIEFKTYPGEGHANRKPENQADALERMSAFFRRHLQPWNLRDNPSGNQVQY